MRTDRPPLSPQARADTFAFLVGFAALGYQAWLIRRLLAVFGGNELTIALALTIWLLCSGLGALVGSRAKRVEWFVLFGFPLLAAIPLMLLLESFLLPDLLGLLPGQAAGPLEMLAGSFFLAAFPAIACGIGFSRAVALQPESKTGAGRAYLFEALGALAAGVLFTVAWAFPVPPERTLLLLAVAPVLVPLFDAGIPRRRLRLPLIGFALFTIPTIHLALGGSLFRSFYSGQGKALAADDARSGFLAAVRDGDQTTIFLDGSPVATIPDPERDQPLVHIPLSFLAEPRRALVIGGAYSSLAPEMLRHPLQHLDFIQPDPAWIDLERQYGRDPALPRLSVFSVEPRAWLRGHPRTYDLIILNLPVPTSAAGERFFTVDFFRDAHNALAPGGILAFYAGATPPNLAFSRGDAAMAAGLLRTARAVFPQVTLFPLGLNLALAGDERSPLTADPGPISAALARRGIDSVYLNPAALAADLDPARVKEVARRLDRAPADISSALHPRAYLSGLIGWAERVTSPDSILARLLIYAAGFQLRRLMPILLLPLLAIGLRFGPIRARAGAMAAAAGFGAIVIEIALLIAFQMQAGSVYFALAGLTAAFMAGLGLGAGRAASAGTTTAARAAAIVVALAAGLAPVAVVVAVRNNFSSTLTFALFAALLALLGAGVGATFVAATALSPTTGGPSRSAGLVYGLELLGSAGGGLIAGVILIPCFGILGTLTVGAAGMLAAGGLAWPARTG